MSRDTKVLGIFSKTAMADMGQGGSAQRVEQTTYWFARRQGDGRIEVQPLNTRGLPSGIASTVAQETFLAEYAPEPRYYQVHPNAFLDALKYKVDSIQDLDKAGLDAAEIAFCRVSLLGENTPGGGKTLPGKDHATVRDELNALLGGTRAHQEQQKRQLNDFAVNLRKSSRHDEAIQYYQGALAISDQDENLHFNIARAYFEVKDYESCVKHLRNAMNLNPEFDWAARFLDYIKRKAPDLDARVVAMFESSGSRSINL